MADTRVQVEVEVWIRENWLPRIFGQKFRQKQLELTSGGKFVFDGVSGDERVVATVSTSGALTARGKRGSGKLSSGHPEGEGWPNVVGVPAVLGGRPERAFVVPMLNWHSREDSNEAH